ncbi:MAG: PD-(D/E)XK nuclease family protein [Treponema sp.]|nr:PD-(D/E)XK nuclease family protein [Treponema sp.]
MLKGKEIFDPALDDELPPPDREIYQEARRRYREIADERDLSVSSLVSRLWYDLGYRYEALWSSSSQVYLDLYDLFFELARTIEDRGQGLIEFLDYLEDLEGGEEKADDSILPGEGESGVHLMSIHRCKGLEFPVVFVYGCGHGENTSLDHRLALFSESRGLSLCLPPAEELPGSGDYFFLAESGEHLKKTEAELKRLLYVAMTRAESELYITAAIPKQSRNEKQQLNPESFESYEEFIVERFEQYRTRDDISSASFLRLLPQLDPEHPLYTIEAVYNYSPAELRQCAAGFGGDSGDNPLDKVLSMEEAAFRAGTEYDGIPGEDFYRPSLRIAAASGLHIKRFFPSAAGAASASSICGDIDSLLEQTGLKSEDFGIIVHAFIEDRFNGRKQRIPPRFAAAMGNEKRSAAARAARTMADIFFDSPLGRRTASADFRKTEYPVLTAVDCGEGRRILVAGKIDLLFNDGNGFCIVDFKTDRDEDISRHAGQLAVYRRAAEDIFGGPVECRLFYLRNGHDADLSAETDQISLEELAAAWTLENT